MGRINSEIVDTAGMDEYSRLSRKSTVGVDGYILVYSITSMSSFENIRHINNTLLHMLGDPPSIPRVLVGAMCDLDGHRQVSEEDGFALAAELGISWEGEVSSKQNIGVINCFQEL